MPNESVSYYEETTSRMGVGILPSAYIRTSPRPAPLPRRRAEPEAAGTKLSTLCL